MLRRLNQNLRALIALAMVGVLCLVVMSACSSDTTPKSTDATSVTPEGDAPLQVNVALASGPISVGMASFVSEAQQGKLSQDYHVAVVTSSEQIAPAVEEGQVDIAVVTPSIASKLYNETDGNVMVVSIDSLGALGVVTGNKKIRRWADLAGKTVYMTDEGSVSEFVVDYLLESVGIADKVDIVYKSDSVEVAAMLRSERNAVGILSQPYAAVFRAEVKDKEVRQVMDVSKEWDETVSDASRFVGGVTVVRKDFAKENPGVIEAFLEEQAASVELAAVDPYSVLELIPAAGIMDAEMTTEVSVRACHPEFITGKDMRAALADYLNVLYNANPSALGGYLPSGDFYYGV